MTKPFKIAFTVSVLINLLLAGIMAGCLIRDMGPPRPPAIERLSPEGRAMMKDSFERSRESMEDTFRRARQAREKVNAILSADSFDADAYIAASGDLRARQIEIMERRAATAGDLAARLSPADRKIMADWLSGPGRPGWKRGAHKFGPERMGR